MATIGITDHAQDQMGDITFIDEAEVGEEVEKGGQLRLKNLAYQNEYCTIKI